MNVSGQPACSTILADRASKQQGITWQDSCDNNARKSEAVPAIGVMSQGPPSASLGQARKKKEKESWITTAVREAEPKSKLQATQSHILESDESKAHNEQEGAGKT